MVDFISKLFGKKQDVNTNSTTTAQGTKNPWATAIPYLTQGLQSGQDIFNQYSQLSPDEQGAAGDYASVLKLRNQSPIYGAATDDALTALGGGGNPVLQHASTIAPAMVNYDMGTANPARARATQGALDPTSAYMAQLSGQSNNPYLHQMADAASQQQRQTYQDQADDANTNLTHSVLPAIRSGAVAAGGYGGSRQGIAEGTAIGQVAKQNDRNARDLAQSSGGYYANLAGTDYEAAQGRQAQAASELDARAQQAKQFDAGNAFQARTTNAANDQSGQEFNVNNINTQNNQELQRAGLVPQIQQAGLNLGASGDAAANSNYDSLLSVLGLPRQTAQGAYSNWMSPLDNTASLGGSTNSTSNTSGQSVSYNRDSAFNIAQMLAAMAGG